MINKIKNILFRKEYKKFKQKEESIIQEKNDLVNQLEHVKNEMMEMASLYEMNVKELKNEHEQKISQLKEKRKSSPFTIMNIEKIGGTPFYDSKWIIVLSEKKSLKMHRVSLTRRDTETEEKLEKNILDCQNVDEIYQLDQKNTIYYD